MTFLNSRNILFFFFFAFIFAASLFPITDNDVWWHLKTGQIICDSGSIPCTDTYSYTIPGKKWLTQEWLSELSFFAVYKYSGLYGLTLFKAFLVLLIFLLVIKNTNNSDDYVLWLVLAAGFLAARDGLRERPQLFSYIFVALFVNILSYQPYKKQFVLVLLMILWANLHGASAFLGIGITLLFLLFNKEQPLKQKAILLFCISCALLINPNSCLVLTYLYTFFHEGFNKLILEYQSPSLGLAYIPYFLYVAAGIASFFIAVKKNVRDILVFSVALAASLLAIRNIPVFVILSAPIIAGNISQKYRIEEKRRLLAFVAGFILFTSFYLSADAFDFSKRFGFGLGDNHKARYAVKFIGLSGIKGPIFNDYDFGGYLIWHLYPERKVFADGRLVEYGTELIKDSFYYYKPEVWDRLDKKYAFNAAIIPQDAHYPASYLDSMKNWVLVYWDDGAMVYVKNNEQNSGIIRKFGYRILKPNSPFQDYLKNPYPGLTIYELERSLYYSPCSERAKGMCSMFDILNQKR